MKFFTCFVVMLALCVTSSPTRAQVNALVVTSDFSSGSTTVLDIASSKSATLNVESVFSDATARYFNGYFYVVNRVGADNVQVLDPDNNFATALQFSVGNGSNPHDIGFVSASKAYVTRYDSNILWIVDPSDGSFTGSIDLSSYADVDGLCEMDQILVHDGLAYVTVQRLDRNNFYQPTGTSYLVVIDVATDAIVDTDPVTAGVQPITLTGTNPFTEIKLFMDNLFVSTVGNFVAADGGVEFIDPVSSSSTGFVLTEAVAGGDVVDVEIKSTMNAYAIISTPGFSTELIRFNPTTGAKIGTVFAPGGYVLNDIELSPIGDEVLLADRSATAPGIRCFDYSTGSEITTGPINTGLPPVDIAIQPAAITATDPVAAAARLGLNYPNPFNPATTIPYQLGDASLVQITVHDVLGRTVATLIDSFAPAGTHSTAWDGRTLLGSDAATGVYLVALRVNGELADTRKIVLAK